MPLLLDNSTPAHPKVNSRDAFWNESPKLRHRTPFGEWYDYPGRTLAHLTSPTPVNSRPCLPLLRYLWGRRPTRVPQPTFSLGVASNRPGHVKTRVRRYAKASRIPKRTF